MSDGEEWDDPPMANETDDAADEPHAGLVLAALAITLAGIVFYLDGHPVLAFGALGLLTFMATSIGIVHAAGER